MQHLSNGSEDIKRLVLDPSGNYLGWLLILSDCGMDHDTSRLVNLIPLFEIWLHLKLDIVESWSFCPGNSKTNPAELVNHVCKTSIRGTRIGCKNSSLEDFQRASQVAVNLLEGTTFAGMPIHIHQLPLRNSYLQSSEEVAKFCSTRMEKKKQLHQKDWKTKLDDEDLRDIASSAGLNLHFVLEMEDYIQGLIAHSTFYCYGVVISKCNNLSCNYCKEKPVRSFDARELRTKTTCDGSTSFCSTGHCMHTVLKTLQETIDKLKNLIRIRSICKACGIEGHATGNPSCPLIIAQQEKDSITRRQYSIMTLNGEWRITDSSDPDDEEYIEEEEPNEFDSESPFQHTRGRTHQLEEDSEDAPEEFEVRSILGHKIINGKLCYEVQWVGYEDHWYVDEDDAEGSIDLIQEYWKSVDEQFQQQPPTDLSQDPPQSMDISSSPSEEESEEDTNPLTRLIDITGKDHHLVESPDDSLDEFGLPYSPISPNSYFSSPSSEEF